MARIRTIKPEFFTSLTIADLTPEQRLTFIGLWTQVDDEGRWVDDARLVKAAVWPLDDRTAADVDADLWALTESSLIARYIVDEKRYLAVTGWSEHQRINRPTPSRLPAPESGEPTPPQPRDQQKQPTTDDSLSPHGAVTEDSPPERKGRERKGRDTPPPPAGPPKGAVTRGTRLPGAFQVTPEMAAWAAEHAPSCGTADHEAFCDYWRGIPGAKGRKVDWTATWRNWMRREHERRARPTNTRPTKRATADDRIAEIQALKNQPPLNLIRGELA